MSKRFEDALDIQFIDGKNWRVQEDFHYETDVWLQGVPHSVVQVPKGFITDFASIPRPLWSILPPTGGYGKAAVLHDYLYRTPQRATRPQADKVLLEAMAVSGVSWLTRKMIYLGVRVGGSSSYHGEL